MKAFIVLAALTCTVFSAEGQTENYISPGAYRKMMADFYNYALLGTQTPTSGFKIETTKPSISLKGNIGSANFRQLITNLEIEGGLDNGLMQLLSGNKVSRYFKGSVGFNYLFPSRRQRRFELSRTEERLTSQAIRQHDLILARQIDSFIINKIITDDTSFLTYNFQELVQQIVGERRKSEYRIDGVPDPNITAQMDYFKALTIVFFRKYGAYGRLSDSLLRTLPEQDRLIQEGELLLGNFRTQLNTPGDTTIKAEKMLADYDRIKEPLLRKHYQLNDKKYDYEIQLTKVNWPSRRIWWVNLSLSAGYNKFWLVNGAKTDVTQDDVWIPAATLSINHFIKSMESARFSFIRAGLMIQKATSLTDLSQYTYKKDTKIYNQGGVEIKSTEEGIAYDGVLAEEFGLDLFVEGMVQPTKLLGFPGLYIKAMYRRSDAWFNQTKIPLELGLLWAVNSQDKDAKNLLSIIPYVSWTSLRKEYKDATLSELRTGRDKFSFGIKVGIPVNIGK